MPAVKTGIFWNDILKGQDWPIIGDKFTHFPGVLEEVLEYDNVQLFESKPAPIELLYKVHTPDVVEQFTHAWYYQGGIHTIGGMVEAVEKICTGELTNAVNFMVAVGHHAGKSFAWGGTYASLSGPAIVNAREKCPVRKFAVLDTDSHDADGFRDISLGDHDILHVCFCSHNVVEDAGTKICVNAGYHTTDDAYLDLVRKEFIPRVNEFNPYMIVHLLGHDTAQGDYGDRGLSKEFFLELIRLVNDCAQDVCEGRYLITSMGGDRVDLADYIFPNAVRILSGK
jgi:acetoin utilization deacetylase AcuC-like enzyme